MKKMNEYRKVRFAKTNSYNLKICLGLPLPTRKGESIYIFLSTSFFLNYIASHIQDLEPNLKN